MLDARQQSIKYIPVTTQTNNIPIDVASTSFDGWIHGTNGVTANCSNTATSYGINGATESLMSPIHMMPTTLCRIKPCVQDGTTTCQDKEVIAF